MQSIDSAPLQQSTQADPIRIIRAQHLGMCFGVRDAITLAQQHASTKPLTILGARAMLDVALDVLLHRLVAPDKVLSEGPVIEIIRNVRAALDRIPGDTGLKL